MIRKRYSTKWVLIITILVIVLMSACTSSPAAPAPEAQTDVKEGIRVAFVLPGIISDGSYNTQAYQAIKVVDELPGVKETAFVENKANISDAAKAVKDYVNAGYDVVWAHSGAFGPATEEVAAQFPDTTFVIEGSPTKEALKNVWYLPADWEDTYFLAGALAGQMTKSNVVGFIGGQEFTIYAASAQSFEEGAKYVNPNVKAMKVFTGSFDDPIKGKEAASGLIEAKADVIIHAMNTGAFGLFEAANAAEDQVWVIGKDVDQMALAPDVILTSVVLDYQFLMPKVVQGIINGEEVKTINMNMSTGVTYLAPFYGRVPTEIETKLNDVKKDLLDGKIKFTKKADLIKK